MAIGIIAGEARGRRLFTPEGNDTRPTSARVRESLFNVIARRLPDACVLDLFGGSGVLALESLSRGAARAVINEPARGAMAVIRRNVELLKWQDRVTLVAHDYLRAIDMAKGPFDVVFIDPPYRMTDAYAKAATRLKEAMLIDGDSLLVMEHAARIEPALPEGFSVIDRRKYGDTAMALVQMVPAD